jgi:hypothetical protein
VGIEKVLKLRPVNIVLLPEREHDEHMLMASKKIGCSLYDPLIVQLLGGTRPTFKSPGAGIISAMQAHPKDLPRVLRVKSYGRGKAGFLRADLGHLYSEATDPQGLVILYLMADPSLKKLAYEMAKDLDGLDAYCDQINVVEVTHLRVV